MARPSRSRLWRRLTARAASRRVGSEYEPVRFDRDGVGRCVDLDPDQGLHFGRHDPDLAHQRRLGSGQIVVRCGEVLDPGNVRQKLSDTLTTGIGNLVDANMAQESASVAGPAGQAAAWHPGPVDRQSGAADHPVSVPGWLIRLKETRRARAIASAGPWFSKKSRDRRKAESSSPRRGTVYWWDMGQAGDAGGRRPSAFLVPPSVSFAQALRDIFPSRPLRGAGGKKAWTKTRCRFLEED